MGLHGSTDWISIMIKLTARQQQVLDFIRSALEETGFPPTRAEIAAELGFKSPNAAEEHLKALARKGAIEIMPGASRGLRIIEEQQPGLPIVGRQKRQSKNARRDMRYERK